MSSVCSPLPGGGNGHGRDNAVLEPERKGEDCGASCACNGGTERAADTTSPRLVKRAAADGAAVQSKRPRPSAEAAHGEQGAGAMGEEEKMRVMQQAARTLISCMGEDTAREGLVDTPKRMAKSMLFLTSGYTQSVADVVGGAIFDEPHSGMVIVKDIPIFSLCEHHLLPFTGHVHIGYVPDGKVIGLSKLARIADVFARRLQVQERLTKQIADALQEVLEPRGVAVIVEASHMCMAMRGVMKVGATTTTRTMLGSMAEDLSVRDEFYRLVSR